MTEYWAVAASETEAIEVVRFHAPLGYTFSMTNRRLPKQEVEALQMRLHSVRKLP